MQQKFRLRKNIFLFALFFIPLSSNAITCQFITQNLSPHRDYGSQGGIAPYSVGALPRPYFMSTDRDTITGSDIISQSEDKRFVFAMNSEIDAMYSYKRFDGCKLEMPLISQFDRHFTTLEIIQHGNFFYRLAKSKTTHMTELQVYSYDFKHGHTFPDASAENPSAFIHFEIDNATSMYYSYNDGNIYIATGFGLIMIYKPVEKPNNSLELEHVATISPLGSIKREVKKIKVVRDNVFLLAYDREVNDSVTIMYLKLDENKHVIKHNTYTIHDNRLKHQVLDHISNFIVVYRKYSKPNMLPYRVFVYHRGMLHEIEIDDRTWTLIEAQKKVRLDISAPILTSPMNVSTPPREILFGVPDVIFATEKYQTGDRDLFSSTGSKQVMIYPETPDKEMNALSYFVNIGTGSELRIPTDNLASFIVNDPK